MCVCVCDCGEESKERDEAALAAIMTVGRLIIRAMYVE